MALRAAFIDKDGTLVEDLPYNVDPGHVRFTPRALPGLRLLRDLGCELVVVSNQSGVARGYFEESQLQTLIDGLRRRLWSEGLPLAGFYYCPHLPANGEAGCDCRKPAPGLLLRAARELDIDLQRSVMIGDILDDVEAANRGGCCSVLLDNGNETEWLSSPLRTPRLVARDLLDAAQQIAAWQRMTELGSLEVNHG